MSALKITFSIVVELIVCKIALALVTKKPQQEIRSNASVMTNIISLLFQIILTASVRMVIIYPNNKIVALKVVLKIVGI